MKSDDPPLNDITSCTNSERRTTVAVAEAVAVLRSRWDVVPPVGLILGTGLGGLADHIAVEAGWQFEELPHFARSTADGHRGRLLGGTLGDVAVIAMDGRFHAYEGYAMDQVTFPVRVLAALGVQLLIVSNASGGLNPSLNSGDILLMDDHVNLLGAKFAGCESGGSLGLHQSNEAGGRHTPPNNQDGYYSSRLLELAECAAGRENIAVRRGTYIAMLGPNYETRAEYRWLKTLGDVVGMSTVPEVVVAKEIGLPVLAFSMVTNVFRPDDVQQNSGSECGAEAAAIGDSLDQRLE
jgi:purine-nucleoside phosphorylase